MTNVANPKTRILVSAPHFGSISWVPKSSLFVESCAEEGQEFIEQIETFKDVIECAEKITRCRIDFVLAGGRFAEQGVLAVKHKERIMYVSVFMRAQ